MIDHQRGAARRVDPRERTIILLKTLFQRRLVSEASFVVEEERHVELFMELEGRLPEILGCIVVNPRCRLELLPLSLALG